MIGVWIPLSRGKCAIVDAADYETVASCKWSATLINGIWYAVTTMFGSSIYLHRFILWPEEDERVDHRDGDGLNCQRENLRVATSTQNNRNRRRNSSRKYGAKFKGVRFHNGKWAAQIGHDKKQIRLGHFTTQEAAARAYDAAAIILHGEFARLNFPQEAA